MKFLLILLTLLLLPVTPARGLELQPPEPPESARQWIPREEDISQGFGDMADKALNFLVPELKSALSSTSAVLACGLVMGLVQSLSGSVKQVVTAAGTAAMAALLLKDSRAMIQLAVDTVRQLSDYGKLLLPVMTAAMAAQGGTVSASALYAGAAFLNSVLSNVISRGLIRLLWVVLALGIGYAVTGEALLKNLKDSLKKLLGWVLKILLMVFTGFLSLTGVVSGTTDAAALKAAKIAISTFVPLVGGVLSEASEAVLVSAGLLRNAAGVYGIFAVIAIAIGPFLKIAAQYLSLKLAAIGCSLYAGSALTELMEDFCAVMGLLLAMTGAVCVMLLISVVCFLREVG